MGGVAGIIAEYLGALAITYILTRMAKKFLRKKHPPKTAAIYAFIWISLLSLTIVSFMFGLVHNSLAQGFIISFFTYVPCLVLWLVMDIRKAGRVE